MLKKRKILFILLCIVYSLIFLNGCNYASDKELNDDDNTLKVVTTLFPNYDFARQITKDKAEVTLLLPPGVEAHSYEPTPKDIVNTHKADVFIYTSSIMEPWANQIIKSLDEGQVTIRASSQDIEIHDDDLKDDPHIWVNPIYAQDMIRNICDAICKADPDNTDFYKKNAENYINELNSLDNLLKESLSKVKQDTIIYSGHFVFGHFTNRYNLKYVSPYEGYAPDSEPTPKNIAELIDLMESLNIKVIYYEELIDPKIARVISEQTGANMLLLHGAHNVTKEELEDGINYIDIMKNNLENLKIGLGYDE